MRMVLVMLSLFPAAALFAQLDGTDAQLTARYGTPVISTQDERWFDKDGFIFMAALHQGKAGFIAISKGRLRQDKAPLSTAEIQNFLKANSGGENWSQNGPIWKTPSGRVARYDATEKRLILVTASFLQEAMTPEERAAEGF